MERPLGTVELDNAKGKRRAELSLEKFNQCEVKQDCNRSNGIYQCYYCSRNSKEEVSE